MNREQTELINRFINLNFEKDLINNSVNKIEEIISNLNENREENNNFIINRRIVTNLLELFYRKKMTSEDVYNWTFIVIKLDNLGYIDFTENTKEIVGGIFLACEEYPYFNDSDVEFYLKELWPLGDYKFKK